MNRGWTRINADEKSRAAGCCAPANQPLGMFPFPFPRQTAHRLHYRRTQGRVWAQGSTPSVQTKLMTAGSPSRHRRDDQHRLPPGRRLPLAVSPSLTRMLAACGLRTARHFKTRTPRTVSPRWNARLVGNRSRGLAPTAGNGLQMPMSGPSQSRSARRLTIFSIIA